jgi:hypothetical protein
MTIEERMYPIERVSGCRSRQALEFRAGPDPDRHSYFSFASFSDPDGNSWLLQEVTTRFPGRGLSSFDVATLTELLREAEKGHGEYEAKAPAHHWSDWYAAYIVARQHGTAGEEAAEAARAHMDAVRQ